MSLTDPLGDMLTRIRNGQRAKMDSVLTPASTLRVRVLDVLQREGYIRGYHAELALERIIDFTEVVVTVSLGSHRKAEFDRFENHIHKLDEVTDCIATGGGMDYVLKTVTPSLAAFQRLMEEMLSADLAIERYMTYIATRQVKRSQPNLAKLTAKSE